MTADTGHIYLCIDLKSFYASVECVERGLDPLTTRLVVADPTRSNGTICLAVTPAMKALGVKNRCRVFEIPAGIEYLTAKPCMKHYMEASADIYEVYLRYISPEDIHIYSIDECFIDATPYLELYGKTPRELATMLMDAVREETGIPATAGMGTNLFLAKVALDITAKHAPDGIGWLDEAEFKRQIWGHRPITDIWNIGPGIANRLLKYGARDLEGVTRIPERELYAEFGVNAEFLIDHAWGREPCTIAQIHAYEPQGSSLVNGQVLPCDYTFDEALVVLREMCDVSVLELVEKHLVTDHVSVMVGYGKTLAAGGGHESEDVPMAFFEGGHGTRPVGRSRYGAHDGAGRKLHERTNSFRKLWGYVEQLFREVADPNRPIHRVNLGFGNLLDEDYATLDLFADEVADAKERKLAEAQLAIKGRFGKNAVIKGTSLQEKATGRERNTQVGGHAGGEASHWEPLHKGTGGEHR